MDTDDLEELSQGGGPPRGFLDDRDVYIAALERSVADAAEMFLGLDSMLRATPVVKAWLARPEVIAARKR